MKLCTFADGGVSYVEDGGVCPLYSLATGSELVSEGAQIVVEAHGAKWPAWMWLLILAAIAYEKK